ncbi:hypothetical protein KUTeg_004043 [Tegillarca granosa]|uniref:Uncharacterized protein n=1 Tax=Tegillarca granosa TaxID=220873 RepID=A0ABQ9FNU4_TEGGR|nr:hypothetical protein KUTeg_004043 [Tegillarca granosa]
MDPTMIDKDRTSDGPHNIGFSVETLNIIILGRFKLFLVNISSYRIGGYMNMMDTHVTMREEVSVNKNELSFVQLQKLTSNARTRQPYLRIGNNARTEDDKKDLNRIVKKPYMEHYIHFFITPRKKILDIYI